ncbi:MAG: hypothetical protein H7X70_03910 [Candidatus Kapabacteria bacterium]|nr:hypothetical protein [Candidatus Kapabacteria bacterium]
MMYLKLYCVTTIHASETALEPPFQHAMDLTMFSAGLMASQSVGQEQVLVATRIALIVNAVGGTADIALIQELGYAVSQQVQITGPAVQQVIVRLAA